MSHSGNDLEGCALIIKCSRIYIYITNSMVSVKKHFLWKTFTPILNNVKNPARSLKPFISG